MPGISDILANMIIAPWDVYHRLTGPPYLPTPANDVPAPAPGSPAHLQGVIEGHQQVLKALTDSLSRATDPNTRFYDPQRADFLRQMIGSTSNDLFATQQRLNAVTPRLAPNPVAPPVVTEPSSGGLMSREEALQHLYEGGQTPPGMND